jgi:hypothetical protein
MCRCLEIRNTEVETKVKLSEADGKSVELGVWECGSAGVRECGIGSVSVRA